MKRLFTKALSFITAFAVVLAVVPVTYAVDQGTVNTDICGNIALNKQVEASSIESEQTPIANAFDGDSDTRWASEEGVDPQWVIVDLGSNTDVEKVVLKWETARAKSYQIQISNDKSNWTHVYSTTLGEGDVDEIIFDKKVNTRYIKLYGTERNTPWGYSLYEFEVYSTSKISTNISTGKQAQASSIESEETPIANAFDGDSDTRWASEEGVDPQWIVVDLGETKEIGRVILRWETARAKSYKLQVSSNENEWVEIFSTSDGEGDVDNISFDAVNARYVRMYGTERSTPWGYSLFEFEVYTPGALVANPPQVPVGLKAYSVGNSQIRIIWKAPKEAESYDIEVDGEIIENVVNPYLHEGLAANSTHTYKIRAKNAGGMSLWTEAVEVLVPEADTSIEIKRPFPQSIDFEDCIKPNHVSQQKMNKTIEEYYDYWKEAYMRESNGITPGGGYYVEMQGTGGDGNEITTSEAHGYGMVLFALMAGYDPEAKQYFDGMYNMFEKHRSTIDPGLMSWVIDKTELRDKDKGSATDGDMDVAYACILAHYQWGSDGEINYLETAKSIIDSLKESDMSTETKRVLLGDWDTDGYSTRASDWMADHLRAYGRITNDLFWTEASDTIYDIIKAITANYSPDTGLMPDFIVGEEPKPAEPNFLEADTDDDYSWNSCRYPWRIVTDYTHNHIKEAKTACDNVINWIKEATDGDPSKILAGYTLDGEALVNYDDAAFTAPFVTAAIVDPANQDFLNKGWDLIKDMKYSYYGDTIDLLCMLLISGNWWAPTEDMGNPEIVPTGVMFDDFDYVTYQDEGLEEFGWEVRNGGGGPGPEGCTWSADNIEFMKDSDNLTNKFMRLKAVTTGPEGETVQAEINHTRKYFEGTYAARIRFTDTAINDGIDGDQINEAFFTITPLYYDMDPSYSECDFEYLANGGWGKDGPRMWFTSYETYQVDPWEAVNTSDTIGQSYANTGWHTLVMTVSENEVKYYIDGKLLATHPEEYYPDSNMSINFNIWYIAGGLNDDDSERTYVQDIDWVFHSKDKALTTSEVKDLVRQMRKNDIKRVDKLW